VGMCRLCALAVCVLAVCLGACCVRSGTAGGCAAAAVVVVVVVAAVVVVVVVVVVEVVVVVVVAVATRMFCSASWLSPNLQGMLTVWPQEVAAVRWRDVRLIACAPSIWNHGEQPLHTQCVQHSGQHDGRSHTHSAHAPCLTRPCQPVPCPTNAGVCVHNTAAFNPCTTPQTCHAARMSDCWAAAARLSTMCECGRHACECEARARRSSLIINR
jgi:hypothetical protein